MDYEKRLEAYTKLNRIPLGDDVRTKLKAELFLQKHPHIRAAIREYAYDRHHVYGAEAVENAERGIAEALLPAMVKDGLVREDNDSDDFLQLVLDYKE